MRDRSRTLASFLTVAMAAMLLGAVLSSQIQRPEPAQARPAESAPADARAPEGAVTFDTFKDIARSATQGVVNINTRQEVRRGERGADPFREFFGDEMMERFFGPQGRRQRPETTLGSGFVIDHDGHILTNRHVVDGADVISVSLNGETYDAELVGRDARTDVALLKIEVNGVALSPVPLGDSSQTEVGEWVMAIGQPFGLEGNSVTVGVVSFIGRALQLMQGTSVEMIQTDASINPGNSGGPLLNTRGEVIGINTMIMTRGMAQQSAGVGFAVPINVAKEILPQLRDRGLVLRGWLGVSINPMSEDMAKTYGVEKAAGAVILNVEPGSPADRAGLQAEDVIVAVDGEEIEDDRALSTNISTRPPDSKVSLKVLSPQGGLRDVEVTLGTFPDDDVADGPAPPDRGEELGMTLQDLTPDLRNRLEVPESASGPIVLDVEPGSPADEGGLRRGDVILSVNGRDVGDVLAFGREIDALRADGLARLRVLRAGQYLFVILRFS
jgi:serine protease Do